MLPFVDEHSRVIRAPPDRTWDALVREFETAFASRAARQFARAIRAEAVGPVGRFPEEGSGVTGFRVARADPPHELALSGRHAFSAYALTFRLEALDAGGTRLTAETHAAFPGLAGRAYRFAVIGTGGHALAVRSLLASVARHVERTAR